MYNIPPANVGQEFLELPKPHHHVSKLLILVAVLVCIALLSAVFVYIYTSNSLSNTPAPQNTQNPTQDTVNFNGINDNGSASTYPSEKDLKTYITKNKSSLKSTVKPLSVEEFNNLNHR